MYQVDKYTALMENKRSLIVGGVIFVLLLFMLLGGDDMETSAGEINMPVASEQQERPRAASPRRILGAEKANMEEKLADPFSIAHLTREEMEQAKLAAEQKQMEDMKREVQPAAQIQVPMVAAQAHEAREGRDNEDEGITLLGIVRGEHGGMAILKYGKKSMTVAVGETVGGRTIKEISSDEVRFDDGGCLRIQMP